MTAHGDRARAEQSAPGGQSVPKWEYDALRAVLRDREAELLELKGPCRTTGCRSHRAHRGPCNIAEAHRG